MFQHKGNRRTFSHNLRLASTLSFIAGIVNVAGVLSVATLTTNITGHFAFFAEAISIKNYSKAFTFMVFIFFFLLGAFVSNFLVEITILKKPKVAHAIPMFLEIILLCLIGLTKNITSEYIAYTLLFAMGLQNALVTKISQSTVRTTHLTGLFTDLGIELSQLFFYKKAIELKRLSVSIFLRLSIIFFFFFGCVLGGLFYKIYELRILLFAAFVLAVALIYDNMVVYYHLIKGKINRALKRSFF